MSHSIQKKSPPIEGALADRLVGLLVEVEGAAAAARLAVRSKERTVDDVRAWLERLDGARIRLAATAQAAGL